MIGHINNLEIGVSVRGKLNQVIDFVDNYNANPPLLADILGNSNKTGGHDIISDDSNSIASIINGEIFLYSGTTNAGRVYLSENEADLYNNNGGFYVSEGAVIIPNYFQIKTAGSVIKHNTKILQTAPQNELEGTYLVSSLNGSNEAYLSVNAAGLNPLAKLFIVDTNGTSGVFMDSGKLSFTHTTLNEFSSPINLFTNGGIEFVSNIGIDTTATAGTDVLNIGATNANVINYGNASTIHNFLGTAIYELQVNSYVTDKLITLNYGGTIASGIGVGFEIEEGGGITGFLKTNAARDGFSFQAPSIVHTAHFLFSSFTADRTFDLPDSSGTLALESFVDSKVTDSITNGITTVAPSQNAVFDALELKNDIEVASTTGVALTFTKDQVYGSIATPETGNITFSPTGAKLGVTNLIIHNHTSAPTFGANMKKLSGSGDYVVSTVNYIYVTYINSTEVIYSINQRI